MRPLALCLCAVAACGGDSTLSPVDGGADGAAVVGPDGGFACTTLDVAASVLEHHARPTRDGLYVDPNLTAHAAMLRRDPAFHAVTDGATYAQPLYLASDGCRDVVIVATEKDSVYALDATDGSVVWQRRVAAPVPLDMLPCGDIDPVGITGTPVVTGANLSDISSLSIYFDALTLPGDGVLHEVFALAARDGATRPGWPVDVATLPATVPFDPSVQLQRTSALALGGRVYFGFGAEAGDCGAFHGRIYGLPTDDPTHAQSWTTRAVGGGVWAPGGLASDGTSVYAATGNTEGTSTWADGEAVFRFAPGPTWSGNMSDVFVPGDWKALDDADLDLSGVGPLLVDVPGATPSALVVALGKDGKAYLLDRKDLGGIGGALSVTQVATGEIIGAPAVYRTKQGVYVAFRAPGAACPPGTDGDLVALRITVTGATAPPTVTTAWCRDGHGRGAPIATSSDGTSDAVVWVAGAEGDGRLHGFDGDTGATVFDGGGPSDAIVATIRRFATPIVARGRIFVAADGEVDAFSVP